MTVFLCLIQGFLSLFALIRLMQISTSNPLTLLIFAALGFIYFQFTKNQVECRIQIKDQFFSTILSAIFTTLTILARYYTITLNSQFLAEQIVIVTLTSLGLFLMYYYSMLWLFITCSETSINTNLYPSRLLPVATFIGSLIVFGLYYVVEFPGIMPAKTLSQFDEIHGVAPFSDNVSLVHTSIMDKLYKLFFILLQDSNLCIAVLTALQILVLSFVAAYCINTLQKAHIHIKLCVLAALFYLLPYHGLMATTLSVNTLFAANFAGYIAVLIRLFLKSDQRTYTKGKWFTIVAPYFIFGFMICTLSMNGLVVFIISFPFILITLKEKWVAPLVVSLVILALVAFIKYPFMHIYDIERKTISDCISPIIVNMVRFDQQESTWVFIKQLFTENLPLLYPQGNTLEFTNSIYSHGLLNIPTYLRETILTMHVCIPLIGILFNSGIILWITLISLFLCIKNDRVANMSFLLPVLFFIFSLVLMPPAELNFSETYILFFVMPLIIFLPFIDAESEY